MLFARDAVATACAGCFRHTVSVVTSCLKGFNAHPCMPFDGETFLIAHHSSLSAMIDRLRVGMSGTASPPFPYCLFFAPTRLQGPTAQFSISIAKHKAISPQFPCCPLFLHLHICKPCGPRADVIAEQKPISAQFPCCSVFRTYTLAAQVTDGLMSLWGTGRG